MTPTTCTAEYVPSTGWEAPRGEIWVSNLAIHFPGQDSPEAALVAGLTSTTADRPFRLVIPDIKKDLRVTADWWVDVLVDLWVDGAGDLEMTMALTFARPKGRDRWPGPARRTSILRATVPYDADLATTVRAAGECALTAFPR